jgi:flagellar hook-length control protein FliK
MPNIAINPLPATPSATHAASQNSDDMQAEEVQTSFSTALAREMQDKRGPNESDTPSLKHARKNEPKQLDALPSSANPPTVSQDNPLLALALPAILPTQMSDRADETKTDPDPVSPDAVLMPVMLAMERMSNTATSPPPANDTPNQTRNHSLVNSISKPGTAATDGIAPAPGSVSPDHSTHPDNPIGPTLPNPLNAEHTAMIRNDATQIDTTKPTLQTSERASRTESSITSAPNILSAHTADTEAPQQQAAAPLEAFRLAMNNTITPPVSAAIPDELGSSGWGKSLGQQISWMVAGGHQTAELKLHPADLGPLQVVLSVQNNQAELMFVSREPAVRQAIEAAMPHLKDMMADAGISLGQTSVNAESPKDQSAFGRPERHEMNRLARHTASMENTFVPASVNPVRRSLGLVDTFA